MRYPPARRLACFGIAVGIELCRHEGRLMPCDLRALRLQLFGASMAFQAERALGQLLLDGHVGVLFFL